MSSSSQSKVKSVGSGKSIDIQSRRRKSEIYEAIYPSCVQRMLQNQESLADVLCIRDELIDNALQQCYDNDIKKRSVSFIAKCAYKAMLQILDLQFYFHDEGKNDFAGDPEWTADEAPAPSPPDSWAAYNVPLVTEKEIECQKDEQSKIVQESEPIDLSSVATDYSAPGSLISTDPYVSPSLTEYSEGLFGPNVSEELLPESQVEEEDSIGDAESVKSLFTKIATMDIDVDTSRVYGDSKRRETLRLPKIQKLFREPSKAKPAEMKVSTFTFPPLRADTILQRAPSPKGDEKKKPGNSK